MKGFSNPSPTRKATHLSSILEQRYLDQWLRLQNSTLQNDHSSTPLLSQDVIFNSIYDTSPTGHKNNETAVI